MAQPNKEDRDNPQKQGESCSTGHPTDSSKTMNKNREQGQQREENVQHGQQKGAGQPGKTGQTQNQPQKTQSAG